MISSRTAKLRRSRTINTDSAMCRDRSPSPPTTTNGVEPEHIDGTGDASFSRRHEPGPSYKALKHAVLALTRMDDFICEKLGSGFFAEVFKVIHRSTGEVMALKMNKETESRPNVLRELQLMNRLSHKNILRFLGVCVHEGHLHPLTEYISGGTLEQVLEKKDIELPWVVRVKIGYEIACGMSYLHSREIMHRDLTSKNVLLQPEKEKMYTTVIGDFGLSTKIPDPKATKKLACVGSPFWMAPEVIKGEHYNEKADIFSYGIISCEVTARVSSDPDELPRSNNFGLDYKAFSEKVDYCPLDFLRLAFRCCQMDPQKRPPFDEIEAGMLLIYQNLENDNISKHERRNSIDGYGYKRSRSEDNILQANDSEYEDEDEDFEPTATPMLIGEAMSKDDPFYIPAMSNPFAEMVAFKDGHKIVKESVDGDSFFELPSPSSPLTPPCTPTVVNPQTKRRQSSSRTSQSLPCSPVLLRKAAERLHKESIHGSQYKDTVVPNRYSFSSYNTRSKSVFFPEAVAQRLQFEFEGLSGDRSREGSVESDANPVYRSSRHRRVSAFESTNQYTKTVQVTCNIYDKNLNGSFLQNGNTVDDGHSHSEPSTASVNENGSEIGFDYKLPNGPAGDGIASADSVYPGLSYVSTVNTDSFKYHSHTETLIGSGLTENPVSSVSSISDVECTDPWNRRNDVQVNTANMDRRVHTLNIRETSV